MDRPTFVTFGPPAKPFTFNERDLVNIVPCMGRHMVEVCLSNGQRFHLFGRAASDAIFWQNHYRAGSFILLGPPEPTDVGGDDGDGPTIEHAPEDGHRGPG